MRTIKLVVFGKLKEPYLREACLEYEKRLGAYCKLEVIELAPVENKPVAQALALEAKLALSKINKQASVVALCVEGRQMSSEQFAAWMEEQPSEVVLVIGSSHGLGEELKARAGLKLSLSAMTFPHQLARVMMLEQVYRAFQINAGGKYHK